MKKIIALFFVSFLFPENGVLLTIDDHEFSINEFFSNYPKKQWENSDSLQREKLFTAFINRRLCVLEAEKLGFHNDPDIAIKIRNRSLQILVNESYEHFVARPLIPSSDLKIAKKYAKKELFASHILIGHSVAYLGTPPKRTLDEAFLLSQQIKAEFDSGESFSVLAKKYSDDPSVKKNSGSLGWVQWGATVREFQLAAFALEVGVLSAPVLTNFGYHLVLITDTRPSDYQYLNEDAYNNLLINITKNSVLDQLRPAAIKYDSLKIKSEGVVFNAGAVHAIMQSYKRLQKDGALSGVKKIDLLGLLESLNNLGVVCVIGGKGFGPRWFARRLARIPSSRRLSPGSENELVAVFRTIILQEIAVKDGFLGGVDSSFAYKQRYKEMVSGVLYDAYLKYLVASAPKPDSLDVLNYYNKNKAVAYVNPEQVVVREIRVSNKGVADSLLLLLDAGVDFVLLAGQNSSINPENGGRYGPFSKNKNISIFDAVSLLEKGEISPVLSSPGNNFSIVQLIERSYGSPVGLDRVYVQIESLLIKQNQDAAKTNGINGLINFYDINKNMSFLN